LICVVEPEVPEVGYSEEKSKLHDAGYDAYLTSTVFVNLCNLYGEFTQQFVTISSALRRIYLLYYIICFTGFL